MGNLNLPVRSEAHARLERTTQAWDLRVMGPVRARRRDLGVWFVAEMPAPPRLFSLHGTRGPWRDRATPHAANSVLKEHAPLSRKTTSLMIGHQARARGGGYGGLPLHWLRNCDGAEGPQHVRPRDHLQDAPVSAGQMNGGHGTGHELKTLFQNAVPQNTPLNILSMRMTAGCICFIPKSLSAKRTGLTFARIFR